MTRVQTKGVHVETAGALSMKTAEQSWLEFIYQCILDG